MIILPTLDFFYDGNGLHFCEDTAYFTNRYNKRNYFLSLLNDFLRFLRTK